MSARATYFVLTVFSPPSPPLLPLFLLRARLRRQAPWRKPIRLDDALAASLRPRHSGADTSPAALFMPRVPTVRTPRGGERVAREPHLTPMYPAGGGTGQPFGEAPLDDASLTVLNRVVRDVTYAVESTNALYQWLPTKGAVANYRAQIGSEMRELRGVQEKVLVQARAKHAKEAAREAARASRSRKPRPARPGAALMSQSHSQPRVGFGQASSESPLPPLVSPELRMEISVGPRTTTPIAREPGRA